MGKRRDAVKYCEQDARENEDRTGHDCQQNIVHGRTAAAECKQQSHDARQDNEYNRHVIQDIVYDDRRGAMRERQVFTQKHGPRGVAQKRADYADHIYRFAAKAGGHGASILEGSMLRSDREI